MTERSSPQSLAVPGKAALAAPPPASLQPARGASEATREYLVFEVAGDRMALPLGAVKEILKLSPITAVPRAAHDVLGILSVRGRITTVLCLRARLALPPPEVSTRSARILLVDRGTEIIGVRVDAVSEVLRLRPSEIEAADVIGAGLAEHVTGIGRPGGQQGQVVVLLDPVALLR
ncbi:MAG: chemotaxis protein CheW [Sandaracinaceae bacterium]|jgi:purine-binding chemotaxis protein CheW|nr:chemotaxis protein CheW [Sandaracinaceae bacterium]